MHEMSIALGIVDLVGSEFTKSGAARLTGIDLDIGVLSGIEVDALRSALEVAALETPAEKAEIHIHRIEAVLVCLDCSNRIQTSHYVFECPRCGGSNTRIEQGREMQVRSILVES